MSEAELLLEQEKSEDGLNRGGFQSEFDQLKGLKNRSEALLKAVRWLTGVSLLALIYSVGSWIDAVNPPDFQVGDIVGITYETNGGNSEFNAPIGQVFYILQSDSFKMMSMIIGLVMAGLGFSKIMRGNDNYTEGVTGLMGGLMVAIMPNVVSVIITGDEIQNVEAARQPSYVIAQQNVKAGKLPEAKLILDSFIVENYKGVNELEDDTIAAMELAVYGRPMSGIAKAAVKQAKNSDLKAANRSLIVGLIAGILAALATGIFCLQRVLRMNTKAIDENLRILNNNLSCV